MTKRNIMTEEELDSYNKSLRMYVLVRRDVLPLVHCGVQAGHAVAEYVHYHDNENTRQWVEEDKTLIYLSASEEQIEAYRQYFLYNDRNYQPFYEPDMGHLLTAMAFQPIPTEEGKEIFKDFQLIK